MASPLLPFIEVGAENASVSVIWLHGLGADGHDFEPIIPELNLPASPTLRFILPHAPSLPVTVNGGMLMPAWYDIKNANSIHSEQDEIGIRRSSEQLVALIENEHQRGVPYSNIFLVGFSQGGVIALFTGIRFAHPLGGIGVLSAYLACQQSLAAEKHSANQSTSIFMAHGKHDAVIPIILGEQSRQQLREANYKPEWHAYAMEHAVIPQEINDISDWLQECIANNYVAMSL